jgi:hypothetical protein
MGCYGPDLYICIKALLYIKILRIIGVFYLSAFLFAGKKLQNHPCFFLNFFSRCCNEKNIVPFEGMLKRVFLPSKEMS